MNHNVTNVVIEVVRLSLSVCTVKLQTPTATRQRHIYTTSHYLTHRVASLLLRWRTEILDANPGHERHPIGIEVGAEAADAEERPRILQRKVTGDFVTAGTAGHRCYRPQGGANTPLTLHVEEFTRFGLVRVLVMVVIVVVVDAEQFFAYPEQTEQFLQVL